MVHTFVYSLLGSLFAIGDITLAYGIARFYRWLFPELQLGWTFGVALAFVFLATFYRNQFANSY